MPDTTIVDVIGRRLWTAGGEAAVEAEVLLACGARGRAIASPPRAPAQRHGDACPATGASVAALSGLVAAALHGLDARRQEDIDATLFKLELGGAARARRAALSAASIASARAAARALGQPLHRYLRPGEPTRMPLPVIDVFAGGNDASPIRALSILPFAAEGVDHALELGMAIHRATVEACGAMAPCEYDEITLEALLLAIEEVGYSPGDEIGIVVDVGAGRLYSGGRYAGPDWSFDTDQWSERIAGWLDAYPVAGITEPFAETGALARFVRQAGERVRIIADESIASDAERIEIAAAERTASGVVLCPESAGTLSELRVAFDAARVASWPVFMGGGRIEVDDVSVVHLATAWQAGYVKLGAVGQGTSLARWNEALRIEASLREHTGGFRVEAAARMVH
jgi:enolase